MNRENLAGFKSVIIGGGASGLALAISLATKYGGKNIALVEKLDRVGKKLLSTGNGQCNISNKSEDLCHYHGENPSFCHFALENYGNSHIEKFFKDIGVLLSFEGDKLYPLSKQASSVVDALRFKLESLGVNLFSGETAVKIVKENNFKTTLSSGKILSSETLVIATGGKAQKHLGSDGSGYDLLKSFNHTITKLTPSIVQLQTDIALIKGLKGLKQKVLAKAFGNGRELASIYGDVLFTDFGVSGNSAFYLSSYFKGDKNEYLQIDFCPELSLEELTLSLKQKQENCSYLSGEYLLSGIMTAKVGASIIRNLKLGDLTKSIVELDASKIALAIKEYKIPVIGRLGFDSAQVTSGGVKTSEFNNKTMESKLVKGLYAIGEVLDIDGDCGGFNLKWALSSAFVAADGI